jgi:uncharacterized protein (TIGR02217 family)
MYKNEQFPIALIVSDTLEAGLLFSTDIATSYGGFEQANQNWAEALGEWNFSARGKTADMRNLLNHFLTMNGRAHSFPFKDLLDFSVTLENIGTGDGSNKNFQLQKKYTVGSSFYVKKVKKPESGTVSIYVNGVLKTTGFTLDYLTGALSFTTAPPSGHAVAWTGNFFKTARYDTDENFARSLANVILTQGPVALVSDVKIKEKRE